VPERTCSVEGCVRPLSTRGMCQGHYGRWSRTGDAGPATFQSRSKELDRLCKIPDCGRPLAGRGLCGTHLLRQRHGQSLDVPVQVACKGTTCIVDGCDIEALCRQMCRLHYTRWWKHGTTADPAAPLTAEQRRANAKAAVQRCAARRRESGARCSIAECDKVVISRGWCPGHYRRWFLYGDPLGQAAKVVRDRGTCTVANCDDPVDRQGWCCRHFTRWKKYGDPTAGGPLRLRSKRLPHSASVEDRFWSKVNKTSTCWLWIGGTSDGFGIFSPGGTPGRRKAHIFAWLLSGGQLRKGMVVGPKCGVRLCVRPDHLELVPFSELIARSGGAVGLNMRKTHCLRGHPFDAANTKRSASKPDRRSCRTCWNEFRQRRRATRRLSKEERVITNGYLLAIAKDPCLYCGGPGKEVEHMFPKAKGGGDQWWNLSKACRRCNTIKNDRCVTWFVLRRGDLNNRRLYPVGAVV
jgi:hypothetical protein